MSPSCEAGYDRLARWYAPIEWLRFGRTLQRARLSLLDELPMVSSALFLGEGDGRLLIPFAKRQPQAEIVSVDISRAMLKRQHQRFAKSGCSNRIRFVQADISDITQRGTTGDVPVAPEKLSRVLAEPAETSPSDLAATRFELVVTPFFLDCFDAAEQPQVISRIAAQVHVPGWWYYVDFRIAEPRWARLWSRFWLRCMHGFFRFATDLQSKELVDPTPSLSAHGFRCRAERRFEFGLVTAQLWKREHV